MKTFKTLLIAALLCSTLFCVSQILAEPTPSLSDLQPQQVAQLGGGDISRRIRDVESDVADLTARNGERLSALETKMTIMQSTVSSLSTRVWALLVGILSLLLNAVWSLVRPHLHQ